MCDPLKQSLCQQWSGPVVNLSTRSQPIAGARFDEVLASKLPVDPQLFVTAMELADLKRLQPLWVPS